MKPTINLGPNFTLNSYASPKTEGITCSLDEINEEIRKGKPLFEYFAAKIYCNPQVRENYAISRLSLTEGAIVYDGTNWIAVPPERVHEITSVMGPIVENFIKHTLEQLAEQN